MRSAILSGVLLLGIPLFSQRLVAQDGVPPVKKQPVENPKTEEPVIAIHGTITRPDGTPAVGAKVVLSIPRAAFQSTEAIADSEGQFLVTTSQPPGLVAFGGYLEARLDTALGVQTVGAVPDQTPTKPNSVVDFQLSSAIQRKVRVVNSDGDPVPEATVVLRLDQYSVVKSAKSDPDGWATFLLPSERPVTAIHAFKNDEGFGTAQFAPSNTESAAGRYGAELEPFGSLGRTLRLEGAADPIKIHIRNSSNRSVAGIKVYPWLLRPTDRQNAVNLSTFTWLVSETADANGVATFRWIPKWQNSAITFWTTSKSYAHTRTLVTPDNPPDAEGFDGVIITDRLVELSGRVVDINGNAGAGCIVNIDGARQERTSLTAQTDEAGRYSQLVSPNMAYMVSAKKMEGDEIVAISDTHTGFAVFPNEPLQTPDLVLRKPTRLTGILRDQTKKAAANETITIYHYGASWEEIDDEKTKGVAPARFNQQPTSFLYAKTDSEGRYDFLLGDGEYSIRPPGQRSAEQLIVKGDNELVVDLDWQRESPPADSFTGTVRYPDGSPVASAMIEAYSSSFRDLWKSQADKEGDFSTKENRSAKTLHVQSPDGRFAAIKTVSEEEESVDIVVQPVGQATLTIVDDRGKPKPGVAIQVSKTLRQKGSGRTSRPLPEKRTDEDGRVSFEKLVPQAMYTVSPKRNPGIRGGTPILGQFRIEPGEDYKVTMTYRSSSSIANRRSPTPPTNASRLQRYLASEGSLSDRLDSAIETAAVMSTNVLLIIGSEESGQLEDWVGIRYQNQDYSKAATDFSTLVISRDRYADAVESFLASLSVEDPDGFGMVLLSQKREVLHATWSDQLMTDGELSGDELAAVLKAHPVKMPTAESALNAALAKAKRENKCVLVQESATWCGPCHKLTRFLMQNPIWEKDYIYVKMDHRMEGAFEYMKGLRAGAEGGIPWFAILDKNGIPLVTSNSMRTDKNIGFPSSPMGRAHFAYMLKETAKRLTQEEIDTLVEKLAAP